MIRRAAAVLAAIILILSAVGCSPRYPDLPDDAVAFETGEFIDTADDGAGYLTIEYGGRVYMPFGTIGRRPLRTQDIGECVGYIVQDEIPDTDTRIYTLACDPECNLLMEYYIGATLMNQPAFWRAVDTRGRDIALPPFVDSLGYSYWN